MAPIVTIDRRFIGPPHSANGGYSCGLTALALTNGPAEATLRSPPPVEKPLRLEADDERSALYDGEALVVEARRASVDLELPQPVGFEEARHAAARFDVEAYRSTHDFPECFTCGPAREANDGLCLFPAPIDRSIPSVAWPWLPTASHAGADGFVDSLMLWAALDCPGGLAWSLDETETEPHVLGRMQAMIERRPSPGHRLVVGGWVIGREGRRRIAGSGIWTEDGEPLAYSLATWIVLSEEQAKRFGVNASG